MMIGTDMESRRTELNDVQLDAVQGGDLFELIGFLIETVRKKAKDVLSSPADDRTDEHVMPGFNVY